MLIKEQPCSRCSRTSVCGDSPVRLNLQPIDSCEALIRRPELNYMYVHLEMIAIQTSAHEYSSYVHIRDLWSFNTGSIPGHLCLGHLLLCNTAAILGYCAGRWRILCCEVVDRSGTDHAVVPPVPEV